MTGDLKRKKKTTDELANCSMLLGDVYSEIKINPPEMQTAAASFLSATKLAGNVLHDSEQMLGVVV